MDPVRIGGLRVGHMYRWALGDPEELFIVLGLPRFIDPVYHNYVEVLSSKFSKRRMHVFASDKFFEVSR